jgi:hypothetical protein
MIASFQDLDGLRIQKIETLPKINDGPQDGWRRDIATSAFGRIGGLLGKFLCTLWVTFPEIASMAKPIIVVLAGFDVFRLAKENRGRDFLIAPMISKHERRE